MQLKIEMSAVTMNINAMLERNLAGQAATFLKVSSLFI